jgi:hypothetical protein
MVFLQRIELFNNNFFATLSALLAGCSISFSCPSHMHLNGVGLVRLVTCTTDSVPRNSVPAKQSRKEKHPNRPATLIPSPAPNYNLLKHMDSKQSLPDGAATSPSPLILTYWHFITRTFVSANEIPSNTHRLSGSRWVAYSLASALHVIAKPFDGAFDPDIGVQPLLILTVGSLNTLAIICVVALFEQRQRDTWAWAYVFCLTSMIYRASAGVVGLLETWSLSLATDAATVSAEHLVPPHWTGAQAWITQFLIAWFLVSELEYWRVRFFVPVDKPQYYPDCWLPRTSHISKGCYARVWPARCRAYEESRKVDWGYVVFEAILHLLCALSLGWIFWSLQRLTNSHSSSMLLVDLDTSNARGEWLVLVLNFVLARPVRVAHAAVFDFGMKWLVEGVEHGQTEKLAINDW